MSAFPAGGVFDRGTGEIRTFGAAEYGGDGESPPDSLLSSATDDGWDNEERRLQEKRFTPERLVKSARADIGSDKWAPTYENGEVKNHCNEYVASTLRESGAHVPNVGGMSGVLGEESSDRLNEISGGKWGGNIPSAQDWHNGVPGFERVKTEEGERPMPGDVASNGSHVGIVSGEGKTVSASSETGRVVENDWGFRPGQKSVTFWRYKGV